MKITFAVTPSPQSLVLLAKELYGIKVDTGTHTSKYFLQNVAKLSGREYDASNPGHLLKHLSYSILYKDSAEAVEHISAETCLSTVKFPRATDGEMLLLLSGDLVSMRSEVLNGCSSSSSIFYRSYTTQLLLRFDEQGLGAMFNNFDRKVSNNALILTERRRT